MRPKRKTFVVTTILRGDKAPDLGLGKGVIQKQECTFSDERGRGFKGPMFAAAIAEVERRIAEGVLRFEWKEKRK